MKRQDIEGIDNSIDRDTWYVTKVKGIMDAGVYQETRWKEPLEP